MLFEEQTYRLSVKVERFHLLRYSYLYPKAKVAGTTGWPGRQGRSPAQRVSLDS